MSRLSPAGKLPLTVVQAENTLGSKEPWSEGLNELPTAIVKSCKRSSKTCTEITTLSLERQDSWWNKCHNLNNLKCLVGVGSIVSDLERLKFEVFWFWYWNLLGLTAAIRPGHYNDSSYRTFLLQIDQPPRIAVCITYCAVWRLSRYACYKIYLSSLTSEEYVIIFKIQNTIQYTNKPSANTFD